MEFLFDLLKYTLPSLVVFLTAYMLIRQFMDQDQRNFLIRQNKEMLQHSLPLKLQAYERLALFLERIRIPALMMRFATPDGDSSSTCKLLMLGVQQEFEHNMVQQIYISDKLWEIILLAKNETLHAFEEALQEYANHDVTTLRNHLNSKVNLETSRIIDAALEGIRKEVRLVM